MEKLYSWSLVNLLLLDSLLNRDRDETYSKFQVTSCPEFFLSLIFLEIIWLLLSKFLGDYFDNGFAMATNWNVGDPCRVIYTEDGKAYDAVIEDLNNEESFAVVYFVNWPESKQTVLLPDLMPREPEAEGSSSSVTVSRNSASESSKFETQCLNVVDDDENVLDSF